MTAQEQRKSDAMRFINTIAKAHKMLDKNYSSLYDVGVYSLTNKNIGISVRPHIQISDVRKLAILVDIPLVAREWVPGSGIHEEGFEYKGTWFFGLYDGEMEVE